LLPVQPIRYSDGAGAIYFSKFGGTMNTHSTRTLVLAFAAVILVFCNRPPLAIAQDKPATVTGAVFVSRPSALSGAFATMDVHVNGKKVGSIGNDQCIRVSLPPGRHRIVGRFALTMGWPFEPTIVPADITVGANSVTYVLITPTTSYPSYHATVRAAVVKAGRRC
jgi:hypothetical protein